MGQVEFILLLFASSALATWGAARIVLTLLERDRTKIQKRLSGDQRSDLKDLARRSVTVDTPLSDMPPLLARNAFLLRLNRRLRYAYPEARLTNFLVIMGILGLLPFVLLSAALDSLLIGTAAGFAGAYLPMLVLNRKRARRQRAICEQLPDALDFLCRVLRAGHSLSTGIQMMGDELPQPIGGAFRRCYDQHSLGKSLEDSLREMAAAIDSSDFAFFVTAVLIQRQTGGDLCEVLSNISTMVRSRVQLQQHVKAVTAEGRLTGYILLAFPAALFAICEALNPAYAGVLTGTETGRSLLGFAVVMQVLGFFAIRRIVNVKV